MLMQRRSPFCLFVFFGLFTFGCVDGAGTNTGGGPSDELNPLERGAFVPSSWPVPALRLYITVDATYVATCTASKLGPYAFVTAAHCLQEDNGQRRDSFREGGQVLISNRRGVGGTFAPNEGTPFTVVRAHIYPGWNSVLNTGDIAIVVVGQELFAGYPTGVLTEATLSVAPVGRTVAIYGYGCTEDESVWDLRDELRWGATVLSLNDGADGFRTQRNGMGPDLCVGDSGGPTQPGTDVESGFSTFRIIAINSHMRQRGAVENRYDGHTPIRPAILQWANGLRWTP